MLPWLLSTTGAEQNIQMFTIAYAANSRTKINIQDAFQSCYVILESVPIRIRKLYILENIKETSGGV